MLPSFVHEDPQPLGQRCLTWAPVYPFTVIAMRAPAPEIQTVMLRKAAQGSGGGTIPGGVQERGRCHTEGHRLVGMLGWADGWT